MRLIAFILVLVVATVIGVVIRQEPGYALFAYHDWTLEMPLWLAVLIFMGLIVITLGVVWIFYLLFTSTERMRAWWLKYHQGRSRKKLALGLLELTEGRYKRAEHYLSSSAEYSDVPVIHYLSAAKAADEINALERRDKYLQLAHNVSKGSDIAVRLAEAQFYYHHGDLEQSVAILQHLHAEQPKHPLILKMLANLYENLNDWHSLYSLLPELKKMGVFNEKDMGDLEKKIYSQLLPAMSRKGKKTVEQFWRSSPSAVQEDPHCLTLYCESLIKHHAEDEAEELIRYRLKRNWSSELIRVYGKLVSSSPQKQLNFAEAFLKLHENDSALFLALGRLCMQEKLWGKARDYLERSLFIQPNPETYALLGQLMEAIGQPEKGQMYYKEGLLHASDVA